MDSNIALGFVFVILGAICGGSFGLPSKFAKKDTPWENLWGPFFFFATILIPVALGPTVVKGLFATCSTAGWTGVIGPVGFGLLWGMGSMTLGLSFAFIGLSLAYAINYGAQIMFGSMMPMIIHNRDQICTNHGYVIMAGVAVCLIGVIAAGRAGILKDKSLATDSDDADAGLKKPKIMIGQIVAFVSGILCACYAVAFSFGGNVMEISKTQFENPAWASTFVVTALVLWGGAISSCLYCGFKLTKNNTWKNFSEPGLARILILALVMAALHDGAILCWGLGAARLGDLGVSVGYAIFMSFAIIVGNVNGFLTGEWKGASKQSVTWIMVGIAILIVGVCILAKGNAMSAA